MWHVVSSQAGTFVWLKENKRKREKKKSPEALMNARLDTGEVLMINAAHVFLGNRKTNQRLEDKNNKRHSY